MPIRHPFGELDLGDQLQFRIKFLRRQPALNLIDGRTNFSKFIAGVDDLLIRLGKKILPQPLRRKKERGSGARINMLTSQPTQQCKT